MMPGANTTSSKKDPHHQVRGEEGRERERTIQNLLVNRCSSISNNHFNTSLI